MDIDQFLKLKPAWSMEPALYIVKQMATENPNAHRCGASGTQLFSGADLPYGADRATQTGLISRMNMYANYWLPVRGTIYAALRVKRALVAEGRHRIGEDYKGGVYNVDRGNQTLVLTREKEFHTVLDSRGLRWQKEKKNELFVPRKSVNELISALRTVRGEELYLFNTDSIVEDNAYRGGSRNNVISVRETSSRQTQDRTARVPSVTIRLSKDALEQLRSGNPSQFERLLGLIRSFDGEMRQRDDESKQKTNVTVNMKSSDIEKVKKAAAASKPIKGLDSLFKPRRSARLAELDDGRTETTTPF